MKLSALILLVVAIGVLIGNLLGDGSWSAPLGNLISLSLAVVLFGVGIDCGANKAAWQKLKALGWRVLMVPFTVAAFTLFSAILLSPLLNLSVREALAVAAGFGWYSLSAGIISTLHSPALGGLALLTNVFREVFALLFIPIIARYLGYLPAIGPSGATSMDTTLPIIAKSTQGQMTTIAFISGAILTALVPILVTLILTL